MSDKYLAKPLKNRWSFRKLLGNTDMFQRSLPQFNMRGKTKIPSTPGGCLSLLILFLMLMYAAIKMSHLMSRHNPNISSFTENGVLENDEVINFKATNTKFAFTVEGYLDDKWKDDPKYIKMVSRHKGRKNGVWYERIFEHHRCTNEEYDAFAPPTKDSVQLLTKYKKQEPERGMWCVDWDKDGDEIAAWGTENDEESYQRFEFLYLPCNYLHRAFGDTGDVIHPECIHNKTAQEEYIGNMRVVVYAEEQVFSQRGYGSETVKSHSRFFSYQIDPSTPTFIPGSIQGSDINDETDFLQYGQEDELKLYHLNWPNPLPSAWINYPTKENPSTKYKFISVEFTASPHVTTWQRQTYSLLDWLGDLGGLFDALFYFVKMLMFPFSQFTLKSTMLLSLFRLKESAKEQKPDKDSSTIQTQIDESLTGGVQEPIQREIERDFQAYQRISPRNFLSTRCLCCWQRKKRKKYLQMMVKSHSRISKELDLQKFIHRQRVFITAILSLMSGRQKQFIDKFSQLVMRESSDMNFTSSDAELSDWRKEDMTFTQKMSSSKDPVDQRLFDIFKLRIYERQLSRQKAKSKTKQWYGLLGVTQDHLKPSNQSVLTRDNQVKQLSLQESTGKFELQERVKRRPLIELVNNEQSDLKDESDPMKIQVNSNFESLSHESTTEIGGALLAQRIQSQQIATAQSVSDRHHTNELQGRLVSQSSLLPAGLKLRTRNHASHDFQSAEMYESHLSSGLPSMLPIKAQQDPASRRRLSLDDEIELAMSEEIKVQDLYH